LKNPPHQPCDGNKIINLMRRRGGLMDAHLTANQ
jgi:hypothetical protein